MRVVPDSVRCPACGVEMEAGYHDDETGPRSKAWRAAGNERFGVRTGGHAYLLEVRRFDHER